MSSVAPPSSAAEALEMLRSAMGYLAAVDATAMAAETQAQSLQMLEQVNSMGTAARTAILGAFTSGQGYAADADYSPRAWLINRTRITKGAAVGYTAWVRRAAAHPEVAAELAAGEMSESYARTICTWTDKLPEDCRPDADEILLTAAGNGMDLRGLAGLAGEIYARSLPGNPDEDRDQAFEDRSVRLEMTFGGAGVLHGDLSPECAAVVGTVLDALAVPAGAEDTRTQAQRFHDGLQEAMRRLVAAGLLPERAGQPVKAWVHISLADLMVLDGSSALLEEWTARVRAQWAGYRARASAGGGDGGAWLDGDAAEAVACDAAMAPFVTGEVNPAALEDLVRLCVELDRLGHTPAPATAPAPPAATAPARAAPAAQGRRAPVLTAPALTALAPTATPGRARLAPTPRGRGKASSARSSARLWTCCRARAGSRASCGTGSSAPAWPARACPWTSATPRPSPPGSATPSPSGTSTAGGRAAATSPPRPARSTTSGTRRTAARPAPKTACCSVSSITRS